ncbi:HNH endonuclease [Clostridium intestinale]|uniref:HNH endonuclease n=1 Tax=Clostridium intestinale TaxID=36845 RepID=A0A7D7A0W4_9CLOT|nr:HNH endonuclease [Clostridium intestinale]QLY82242.1 HNH endonuclease [Clostridium intestinale]
MLYRKCPICGAKIKYGTLCECEVNKKRKSYRDYKKRRLQDKEEKERQSFYNSIPWRALSENIKRHYLGLCVLCWSKNEIQYSFTTHHIETLKERFDLRLDDKNLIPLCDCCHKEVHKLMDTSFKDKLYIRKHLKEIIDKFNHEYFYM